MHRLPIESKESPLLWDRSLPEYELFKKSQKYGNLHNMDVILDMIKYRVRQAENEAQDNENWLTLQEANELYLNDDPESQENFFYEVNLLIFRASVHSPAFPGALLSRGLYFLKKGAYGFAINDLDLYLKYEPKERMETISLFRVHGLLSFCYYTTCKYSKSRKHLADCNRYKELLSDELQKEEYLDGVTCFILNHVQKIEKEINSFVGDQEFFIQKKTNYVPFGGFNDKSPDIPLYSASCYYVSEEDKAGDDADNVQPKKREGIYASSKIPQGEYVLVENPLLSSCAVPYAHCAYCFKHHDQMYTCFKCRYKTYCSMKCMKLDKNEHDDECLGYKYLVLIMFDGTILIRLFMRLIKYLAKFVRKTNKKIRKLNTFEKVWEYLIETVKEDLPNAGPYMNYFVTKPDLHKLPDSKFLTLVTYTLRLTVFVQNMTKAKEIFFDKLYLDSSHTFLLMGTMLLRLQGHIYLNSKDFEFYEDFNVMPQLNGINGEEWEEEIVEDNQFNLKDNENQLINEYFNFNKRKEYHKIFKRIQEKLVDTIIVVTESEHTKNCYNTGNPLVNYMDNIANYSIGTIKMSIMFNSISDYPYTSDSIQDLVNKITDLDPDGLKTYLDCYTYNFIFFLGKYFLQARHRTHDIHQMITKISTTLNKLNHSCIPNVTIMHLLNGVIVGKTLRTIKPNEELTISYNADYMANNRFERTKHLQSLGLTCQDTCCTSDEIFEPTNLRSALFCNEGHGMNLPLTPAENFCSQCNKKFTTLQNICSMYMQGFDKELKEAYEAKGSIRDLSIIYSCYYNFMFARFSEGNEERLKIEFKLAKFLAQNNFLQQSANMVFAMRSSLKNYSELSLWAYFYVDMMEIINIILNKVINNGLNTTLDKKLLSKLVAMGFFILQGQERFLTYYHYSENALLPLYVNMIRLNEIKEIINVLITLPIILKNQFFKK